MTRVSNDSIRLSIDETKIKATAMSIKIGIGKLRIGTGGGKSWESYWASLISATVENVTPTNVILTFPLAKPELTDTDFIIAGFTISSAIWTNAILTLSLTKPVVFGDVPVVTFIKSGGTANITNNTLPILDNYTTAAAYSLRKLRTAYTGSAIQVRRSIDNVTQDIGFDGAFLDEDALTTFIGVASGYISIWYDQSGNAVNLANTAIYQPLIVLNGVLLKFNNRPYVSFDGSNDTLYKVTVGVLQNKTWGGWFIIARFRSVPVANRILAIVSSRLHLAGGLTAGKYFTGGRRLDGDTTQNLDSTADITTSQKQLTAIADYANSNLYLDIDGANDASKLDFQADGATSNTTSTINLGGSGSDGVNASDSDIWEAILFNIDQSANKAVIQGNQSAFFLINQEIIEDNIEFNSTIE